MSWRRASWKKSVDSAIAKTRVLILNGGYLSTVPSGGDRHLLALASALAAADGVEVRLVAPRFMADRLPEGVATWLYAGRPPRSTLGAVAAYAGRCLRLCVRLMAEALRSGDRAEVVLASPALVDVVPALLHRRLHGSRLGIFAFHLGDVRAAGRPRRGLQARLSRGADWPMRAALRCADRVFTSTAVVREQLLAAGVPEGRLVRQLPIVELEAVRAAAARTAPEVLFVGRLVARKGVFDLVEAAAKCRLSFGLVGDGEEAAALWRRIEERGLSDRVRLLGAPEDQGVYGLMKGARVLVLPSYEEGYGLVIAEALIAGTPTVAYALPHYEEVFGDALIQVPRGDVDGLAATLERVVAQAPPVSVPEDLVTADEAARQTLASFEGP